MAKRNVFAVTTGNSRPTRCWQNSPPNATTIRRQQFLKKMCRSTHLNVSSCNRKDGLQNTKASSHHRTCITSSSYRLDAERLSASCFDFAAKKGRPTRGSPAIIASSPSFNCRHHDDVSRHCQRRSCFSVSLPHILGRYLESSH